MKNKLKKKSKSDVGKSIKSAQRSSKSENKRNSKKLLKLVKKEDILSISSRRSGPHTRSMKNKLANLAKNVKTTTNKVGLLRKPFATPKPFAE